MAAGVRWDIILFVTAILTAALCLVFWKPGVHTKYRFIRLSLGYLLIHLMDGLVTYVNTPDLTYEWNPLVRVWGFGWGALFIANILGFILIVFATWYTDRYEYVKIPANNIFDYYMKLLHGENYKPAWFWYKFSRNWQAQCAMTGYALYWGLTIGAVIPVVGWFWYMLDIDIAWWHSAYLSAGVGVGVALFQMYVWVRRGYLESDS